MSMSAEDAKDGPQNSDKDSQYFYSYPKKILLPTHWSYWQSENFKNEKDYMCIHIQM